MSREIGHRIGALLNTDSKTKIVNFLGYGTYEGDEYPLGAVGFTAERVQEFSDYKNPKLKLDDGDIVWGCECWWGPEAELRAQMEKFREQGWTINTVLIKEIRTKWREESGKADN